MTSRSPDPGAAQRIVAMLTAGDVADARDLAAREAGSGNAEALLLEAVWAIEGRIVSRDLAAARGRLERAEALGQMRAARILAAMRAAGEGGAADWQGALALLDAWAGRDPQAAAERALIAAMALDEAGEAPTWPRPEVLTAEPYAACFRGFLSAAECAWLAGAAAGRFRPARIFHEGRGAWVADPVRDSAQAGFPLVARSPALVAIERRIAAATGTDLRQGETLQVLRYAPGQQYRPHLDAVPGLANQRVLTFLIWLNANYAGGETVFPETGLRFRGATGDALLFANVDEAGRPDPRTRHAGLPVTAGVKLLASKWIRATAAADGASFGSEE